jgi:hypothetical protein
MSTMITISSSSEEEEGEITIEHEQIKERFPSHFSGFVFLLSVPDKLLAGELVSMIRSLGGRCVPAYSLYTSEATHCVVNQQKNTANWSNFTSKIGRQFGRKIICPISLCPFTPFLSSISSFFWISLHFDDCFILN